MPLQHQFNCPLANGVHARPASALEEVARNFVSQITLLNQRTSHAADVKSILALIGADIRLNDPCVVTVDGPDERQALAALADFLRRTFPHCDDAVVAPAPAGAIPLPRSLRHAGAAVRRGCPVVPGIARGQLVEAGPFRSPTNLPAGGISDAEAEWRKIDSSLQALIAAYDRRLATMGESVERQLLKAHRSLARDLEFRTELRDGVLSRNRTAAGAIADAEARFSAVLAASGNALLRERVGDVQDVCRQLLEQVYGDAANAAEIQLDRDSILIAGELTPGRFLALDRRFLKGLVLGRAQMTSHTVILARAFGIPTLAGVESTAGAPRPGDEAVLDACAGALVTNLTESARRYYRMETRRLSERRARLQEFSRRPGATRDGCRIEIAANISTSEEAELAFESGAEGIGLFRTEMIFVDRDSAPGEEEQFENYRRVLAAAGDRPVVIRTLDIGGDKPLGYLDLPIEANPFLGCRGARIYARFESLFRSQIRALIRASSHGQLKVLVPMAATISELRWIKAVITDEQAKCRAQGIPFKADMPLGAMIEVPSMVFALDDLARELDFFSIGSNDLLQYFMAADRGNADVSDLYDPLQPSFLRLLKQAVDGARAQHRKIGLCGEMGNQKTVLPLLAGLGLDEISVAGPVIPALKAALARLSASDCRHLLASALNCGTAEEVAGLLDAFGVQSSAPLLEPELVILNADALTKEEAIKLGVDQLFVLGRTEDPAAVEEAVWQREEIYSTGFGHGFAIPHCKTRALEANSLVVIKLAAPVAWGSLDGQPVRVVLLLVMREKDRGAEHMQVFSRLARQVMHEAFRARLERESDAGKVCEFLREQLQIESAAAQRR